jgi:acylphosphatase
MKFPLKIVGTCLAAIALGSLWCSPARAQDPVLTPIVASAVAPIVIKAVTPKPSGLAKFQGFVMNANNAQITVRAKGNDMAVQTFSLSQQASTKMQQIIDSGGYQWGDKVTVLYDPGTMTAVKVKGKPSKGL